MSLADLGLRSKIAFYVSCYTGCKGNKCRYCNIIIYVIRNQKVLTTYFLFWYLTNYLLLKLQRNGSSERREALLWTGRKSNSCLRSHTDPFAFSTVLPRLSKQKISMKFYLILRKLDRTRKIFLKIILRPRKMNLRI